MANYREAYGLYCCNGILFNHESPLRPARFVTRKIVSAACRIAAGSKERLSLGRLDIVRDWGWAPDYVNGMWLMLQSIPVDDFILATGELHTVEDFVEASFAAVGLKWRDFVKFDPALVTTVEPLSPCGNPGKAKRILGWKNTVSFEDLVGRLVDSELRKIDS
jgi:GDPmannose 4,6-dehydratase